MSPRHECADWIANPRRFSPMWFVQQRFRIDGELHRTRQRCIFLSKAVYLLASNFSIIILDSHVNRFRLIGRHNQMFAISRSARRTPRRLGQRSIAKTSPRYSDDSSFQGDSREEGWKFTANILSYNITHLFCIIQLFCESAFEPLFSRFAQCSSASFRVIPDVWAANLKQWVFFLLASSRTSRRAYRKSALDLLRLQFDSKDRYLRGLI